MDSRTSWKLIKLLFSFFFSCPPNAFPPGNHHDDDDDDGLLPQLHQCIIESPHVSICSSELRQIQHSLVRPQNVISTQQVRIVVRLSLMVVLFLCTCRGPVPLSGWGEWGLYRKPIRGLYWGAVSISMLQSSNSPFSFYSTFFVHKSGNPSNKRIRKCNSLKQDPEVDMWGLK